MVYLAITEFPGLDGSLHMFVQNKLYSITQEYSAFIYLYLFSLFFIGVFCGYFVISVSFVCKHVTNWLMTPLYLWKLLNIKCMEASVWILQADIEKSLPSGGGAQASEGSGAVQRLRKLMEEVETIKAEREVMENELKDAKFDMSK